MNLFKIIDDKFHDQPEIVKKLTDGVKIRVKTKIVQPDSLNLEQAIEDLSELSFAAKEELFSKELDDLKQEDLDKFLHKIVFISYSLIFFPNEEIFARLKDLTLPNKVKRWFIPIHQIKDEFDVINQSESIQIISTKWIYFIHCHLFANLIDEIYTWAGKYGKKRSGKYYNESHNIHFDLYRTREYYSKLNKDFSGTNFELQMIPIFDQFALDLGSEKAAKKELLKFEQGKTEKDFLGEAFNECSFQFANGQKPYVDIWNLFKLLMPNRNLMDRDTFNESEQYETYERNYRRYQYYTLKKIIPLTET